MKKLHWCMETFKTNVDWKRVDLYGKMGVSKIVREIEGIVGNE